MCVCVLFRMCKCVSTFYMNYNLKISILVYMFGGPMNVLNEFY